MRHRGGQPIAGHHDAPRTLHALWRWDIDHGAMIQVAADMERYNERLPVLRAHAQ